jgi:hypothetical protein
MKLRVPGEKLCIDFQRNFIHNYNDVNLFLIISLGLVLYCYLNMPTINKPYLILVAAALHFNGRRRRRTNNSKQYTFKVVNLTHDQIHLSGHGFGLFFSNN